MGLFIVISLLAFGVFMGLFLRACSILNSEKYLEDEEQIKYLKEWVEKHGKS